MTHNVKKRYIIDTFDLMQLKVHTTSLTNFSHKTWSFDNREFSESSVVAAKVSPTKSVRETKFVLL